MENYSLSDLASVTNGGMNNEFIWIFALLILFGNGGFGWGNRNGGDFSQFATSASQNEILSGQKFDALSRQINQVGDGLCSSTYALNNAITGEGRAIQTQLATVNDNITAQIQSVKDTMAQDKIASLQAQVNQLTMQQAVCGIPKISTSAWGVYPYSSCGCNNI